MNKISTYPFRKFYFNEEYECVSKGEIVVEDDVWMGDKVTIMPGVRIGQGAVITLGSVVTKDVEPYSVVGGVPAKFIKYRFDKTIIEKLKTIDFSKVDKNFVITHKEFFYNDVTEKNIDNLMEMFPKKQIEI